jgi:hypothetical protein
MPFSPYFGPDDKLLLDFIQNKPNRERGSWQGPSGKVYEFGDDSRESASAIARAQREYVDTIAKVFQAAHLTMADIIPKRSSG